MHRFIPEPESPAKPPVDPGVTLALKTWTRQLLKLGEDDVVYLSTSQCIDEGCPIAETTIRVLTPGHPQKMWRLNHPKVAISKPLLAQVLATPPQNPAL